MTRPITEDNLGAWLLKCNPTTGFDLVRFLHEGSDFIYQWTVVDNYRSEMMQQDDVVIFWVSGRSTQAPRGIWGIGTVTGARRKPSVGDSGEYDLETVQAQVGGYVIDVDIPLWTERPVTNLELLAAGIDDLEVQRQANGSNPSWVSKEQLTDIYQLLHDLDIRPETHLPGSSAEDNQDVEARQITISNHGAGFGDPVKNRLVEKAAEAAVRAFYERANWSIDDVTKENCGWDFTCTAPSGQVVRVEVKGVNGRVPTVLLTANELRHAETEDDWWLAVVTDALGVDPVVTEYEAELVLSHAKALVHRAALPLPASPQA